MAGGFDIDTIVGTHPISLPAGAVVFRPNDGFVETSRGRVKILGREALARLAQPAV